MSTLACIYHWYTSAMFVVPVLAVGGWGWWSSKRVAGDDHDEDQPPNAGALGDGPAY